MARPTMSDEPPATKGMTTRIGFAGQVWACAPNASVAAKPAAMRRFIGLSPGERGHYRIGFPHAAEEEAPRGAALAPLVRRAGSARVRPSLADRADGLRPQRLRRQAGDRDHQHLVGHQYLPYPLQAARRGSEARCLAGRWLSG